MEFIKAFEEIDKDESGEISRSGLEEYMKAKNYKPAFVEKWLRIFDIDHSGTISLEEFCNTLGLIPGQKQKERIERRNSLIKLELQRKDINKQSSIDEKSLPIVSDNKKDEVDLKDKSSPNIYNKKPTDNKNDEGKHFNETQYFSSKISITNYTLAKTKEIEVEIIAEDPDITDKLRKFVLNLSLESTKTYTDGLEMAKNVKMILDANFNRSWHVVVGKDSYGCLVTHEEGSFIHVKVRDWGILMWQILKN